MVVCVSPQAEKQQKLAEIKQQLAETSTSVRQGKQLLGALAENYGNMVRHLRYPCQHGRRCHDAS